MRGKPPGREEQWTPHLGGERVVEGIHYGWLMKDHLARYEYVSDLCRGKRVLDVATGTGYGANILRRNGAREVVAVDREQAALDYGSERYGTVGLRWVRADAYDLPFEEEFDVVVSFETIEHLKEPRRFVHQCKRALRPDGLYVVSTPENVGGPFVSEFHELEFSRGEFRDLLEANFTDVTLLGQRRELKLVVRPVGRLPERVWRSSRTAAAHHLYTVLDRLNKAPNLALARAVGLGDEWRARILPIDAPTRKSSLLSDHYYVMLGLCRGKRHREPDARDNREAAAG